ETILETITYGPLPPDKFQQVKDKIIEFADTSALSVQEVKPVNFMTFHLNIPKDVEYPTKVNQKLLTQAQKEWYLLVLDEFDKVGVMRDIRSDKVK
ncbi:hypothetical protein PAXRUDRAFT_86726, partial [Paxillus rubicundulus Ve08.2h10]